MRRNQISAQLTLARHLVPAQFNLRQSVQFVPISNATQLKCQAKGDWPLLIHWFKGKSRLKPINVQDSTAAGDAKKTSASVILVPSFAVATSNSLNAVFPHKIFPQKQGSPQETYFDSFNEFIVADATSQPQQQRIVAAASQRSGEQGSASQFDFASAKSLVMDRYSLASSEVILSADLSSDEDSRDDKSKLQAKIATSKRQTFFESLFSGSSTQTNSNKLQSTAQSSPHSRDPQLLAVQVTSTLSIAKTERIDSGAFKCVAVNHYGYDERLSQLIVEEAPERVDEVSVLETNSRSVTLAWLAPFDGNAAILSYVVQYLQVSDAIGKQSASASAFDTSQVQWHNYTFAASAAAAAANSQQLQSLAAQNNAQQPPQQQQLQQQQLQASALKVRISTLKPQTRYWFQVLARNKLGDSPSSRIVEALTVEEAPGVAPSGLKAVAQSSTSILVSWQKLSESDAFGSVHGYYVAYKALDADQDSSAGRDSDATSNATASAAQTAMRHLQHATSIYKTVPHEQHLSSFSALLTNLLRNTNYAISVQAFNSRGTGPASEPVMVRTLVIDPPRAPKLYLLHATNSSIQLEWRPISQAALSSLRTSSGQQFSRAEAANETSSQLPSPMSWLSQVRGAQAPISTRAVHATTLQAPDADVVEVYKLYQLPQSYSLPSQQQITHVADNARGNDDNGAAQWAELKLPAFASSHLFENLLCGTKYSFYMQAANKVGVSDRSEVLTVRTAGNAPSAPPDKQTVFDVINATCYVLRLDKWLDNGCELTEVGVRFKLDSAREWTQLAHLDLTSMQQRSKMRVNKRSVHRPEDYYNAADLQAKQQLRNSPFDYASAADNLNTFASDDLASDYVIDSPDATSDEFQESTANDEFAPSLLRSDELHFDFKQSAQPLNFNDKPDREQQATNARQASGELSADWHKLILCNLLENSVYNIKVSASNLVGKTETDFRLATSGDLLEWDESTRRFVVGKSQLIVDGASRFSLLVSGDKLGLLGLQQLSQYSLTLTLALIFASLVLAFLVLLKRNKKGNASHDCGNSNSSGSNASPAMSTMTKALTAASNAAISETMNRSANTNSNSSAGRAHNHFAAANMSSFATSADEYCREYVNNNAPTSALTLPSGHSTRSVTSSFGGGINFNSATVSRMRVAQQQQAAINYALASSLNRKLIHQQATSAANAAAAAAIQLQHPLGSAIEAANKSAFAQATQQKNDDYAYGVVNFVNLAQSSSGNETMSSPSTNIASASINSSSASAAQSGSLYLSQDQQQQQIYEQGTDRAAHMYNPHSLFVDELTGGGLQNSHQPAAGVDGKTAEVTSLAAYALAAKRISLQQQQQALVESFSPTHRKQLSDPSTPVASANHCFLGFLGEGVSVVGTAGNCPELQTCNAVQEQPDQQQQFLDGQQEFGNYASIRRNLPHAFRYLTLQQQHLRQSQLAGNASQLANVGKTNTLNARLESVCEDQCNASLYPFEGQANGTQTMNSLDFAGQLCGDMQSSSQQQT